MQELLSCGLLGFALNVDFASQVGAFLDRDPLGRDVPGENGAFAQFDPVARLNVSIKLALHDDALRFNGGFDLPVGADRQVVVLERDGAFDLSIDVQVFAAAQFALDNDRLTNLRQICRYWSTHGIFSLGTDHHTTENAGKAAANGHFALIDYTQLPQPAASNESASNLAMPSLQGLVPACYTKFKVHHRHPNRVQACLLFWCVAVLVAAAVAQSAETKLPQVPAEDLVRETVAREIAAANDTAVKHMFRSRKQTPRGTQTRLYVETNDAMAGMLVAVNDQPLSAQQKQAEEGHLAWLINNPDQLRKKRAREKEDTARSLQIVRALPNAFRYQYDGVEMGDAEQGRPGEPLVRLKFTPNPSYSPPGHVEQVLQGMQGTVLIDSTAHRLALIDGTLFRDVSFGWGIIGHLDRGGHFRVQQADLGDGCWGMTGMDLKITGKILMFKGISLISDETLSDFHRVPDNLPFAKGVELLKSEQQKSAHLQKPEALPAQKIPQ